MPMMNMTGKIRYGYHEGIGARFIELPYVVPNARNDDYKHNMSMFVILPVSRNILAGLDASIHNIKVGDFIDRGTLQNVEVKLPKFKIESEIELIKPLQQMGINKVFIPGVPDFSGIVESDSVRGGMFISKFAQKAIIGVSEEGSVAAAVTVSTMTSRFGGDENEPVLYEFHANRPFYAIIATNRLNPFESFHRPLHRLGMKRHRSTHQDSNLGLQTPNQ